LSRPAKKAAAIRKIFCSAGERRARVELISHVGRTTIYVRRRGGLSRTRSSLLPLDDIVALQSKQYLGTCLPSHVSIDDVGTSVWCGDDWNEAQSGLKWRGTTVCRRHDVRVFLSKVVIYVPSDSIPRRYCKANHLVLERVEGFRLLCTIRQPVIDGNFVIYRISSAQAGVVEGQVVKVKRATIVQLIFRKFS
jgi:hypothetical protein